MMVIYIISLVIGLLILVKSTNCTIGLIRAIGIKTRIPVFLMSSVFLAMATSFPEFMVGMVSVINGEPILSLGDILGANVANISLITGLAVIIGGQVTSKNKVLFKDILITAVLAFIPYFLLMDGVLSFTDGFILLAAYFFYNLFLYEEEKSQLPVAEQTERKKTPLFFKFFLWLLVLAGSAQVVVKSSTEIAQTLGLPLILVGLFLVALGTTLPELIVELEAAKRKQEGIFFGNILGSVAINATFILGIVAMLSPISVANGRRVLVSGIALLAAFVLLSLFLKSGRKITREEGVFLLVVYLVFGLVEFLWK